MPFVIWDVTKVPNTSSDVFCRAIDKEREIFLVIVPCKESVAITNQYHTDYLQQKII